MTPARGSALPTARLDADSTRGAHMRSILGGRLAVYSLAIGVVATVLLGAWMASRS